MPWLRRLRRGVPGGAINVNGWTLGQYEAMVDAIVSEAIPD